MSNPIDNSLGLRPLEVIDAETGEVTEYVQQVDEHPVDEAQQNALDDAAFVRDNLKDVIEESIEFLRDAINVARTNQNPDSISAASKVMDSFVKANKELMNVHRDVMVIKPPLPVEAEAPKQTNVFIATTSEELLQMLKEKGIGKLPPPEQ